MYLSLEHVPEYQELLREPSKISTKILALGLEGAEPSLCPLLYAIQPWRKNYLNLTSQRIITYSSIAALEAETDLQFDAGILYLSKYKSFDRNSFLYLTKKVKDNGLIIVTGAKELGAASMHKWVSQYFSVDAKYAKNHHISFTLRNKPSQAYNSTTLYIPAAIVAQDYETHAGMFSHGKIDKGSELLVEFFKHNIELFRGTSAKNIADFGAGWGYLSLELARMCKDIKNITLYEADYYALQAAKKAIGKTITQHNFLFEWLDIAQENIAKTYDIIVANPPFHTGQRSSPELGQAFITKAAASLRPKGKLLIVANQYLPYEQVMQKLYSEVICRQVSQGFKIIYATK